MERVPCPVYDGIPLPLFNPIKENCEKRLNDVLNFDSRQTDILICSYPKSGTHWSCEIIRMLMEEKEELQTTCIVDTILEEMPNLEKLDDAIDPRRLNSHLPVRFLPRKHIQNKYRLVHVIRNPKDICVSYYHHAKQDIVTGPIGTWEDYFKKFLSGEVPYGSWFMYVKGMEELQREYPQFLLIYYENLHKDLKNTVQKLADFLGVTTTHDKIQKIIQATKFENMSKGGFIFRKGITGDWRNFFTENQNRHFEYHFNREMRNSSYKFIFE